MSETDQQGQLTRKQLREIRLTGSTPIVFAEDAAAAAAEAAQAEAASAPVPPPESEAAEAKPTPVADEHVDPSAIPLTRRQAREQERIRTAAVPVITPDLILAAEAEAKANAERVIDETDAGVVEVEVIDAEVVEAEVIDAEVVEVEAEVVEAEVVESEVVEADAEIATDVAEAAVLAEEPSADTAGDEDDDDISDADETASAPVSAFAIPGSGTVEPETFEDDAAPEAVEDDAAPEAAEPEAAEPEAAEPEAVEPEAVEAADGAGERQIVNPTFGQGLLSAGADDQAFMPSFDELLTVGDSTGSQHAGANALIFTPSPHEGSLSGPVAATGEILITGSYDLPEGLGSRGHALGVADGKDVDAVLIDGELPASTSPAPVAASSAISTLKPAGEVIRPPAPDKSNRLMLVLAIVAGGLALVLAVALIIAFSTDVL